MRSKLHTTAIKRKPNSDQAIQHFKKSSTIVRSNSNGLFTGGNFIMLDNLFTQAYILIKITVFI